VKDAKTVLALLHERVTYDRLAGALYRKGGPGVPAGQRLGSPDSHGRRQATFAGTRYGVDWLIWLLETGSFPTECLSHQNRDNGDDRFSNLIEGKREPCKKGRAAAFLAKAKQRFPDSGHDLSQVVYLNTWTRVRISCPTHGAFERKPEGYLGSTHGCPTCCIEHQNASVRKTDEQRRETERRYRKANRALYSAAALRYYHRNVRTNADFTVALACRNLIARVLYDTKRRRNGRTEALLGYSFAEFKAHIEDQFEPWMSWANHGEWHVDHIFPVSRFIRMGVIDVKVINALSNLRPLSKQANMAKRDKVIGTSVAS